MDEFFGQVLFTHMEELMDRYPMLVHTKGGMIQWAPKRLIITSNTPPWSWYRHVFENKANAKAFRRRMDKVVQPSSFNL
jgi:hypothetical protein